MGRRTTEEIKCRIKHSSDRGEIRALEWVLEGKPTNLPLSRDRVIEKIYSSVDYVDNCWLWNKSKVYGGYGSLHFEGKDNRAHVVSYLLHKGSYPNHLELDHLCRNPACVNPDHLEPVTHKENMRRSPTCVSTINANKTHCINGHLLSGDNLIITKRGFRRCWTCHKNYNDAYRERKGIKPKECVRKDDLKLCTNCRKWLVLEEFYRYRRGLDGRRSICKECWKDKWVRGAESSIQHVLS